MAGLLDALQSDSGLLGLYLMSAGAAKPQRTSLGEGLLGGMQMMQQQQEKRRQQAMQEEDRKQRGLLQGLQMDEARAQIAQRQAQAQQAAQALARQQAFQGALGGATTPQQALAGGGGPTPQNAAKIGQTRAPDWQALALRFPDQVELIKKLSESGNFGRSKVARVEETMDGGRPVKRQFDEYGAPVGDVLPQWKAPVMSDTGGAINALDPVSMQLLQTFKKSQTPDGQASNALGWANFGLSKQRMAQEGQAGQLIETPGGYVRVGKDNTTTPIQAPGGGPLMGKGSNMTEDQSKASGWLIQAENAFKNMKAAGFDKDGKPKSAAYPGVPDALEGLPMIGGLANSLRTADRQKFVQAASSMSEALLRAATGAGVNESEALQKVRELTPLFGEDETTTAQKMAAIPLYIESLKVRAGPGAAKVAAITSNAAPTGAMPTADAIAAELARRAAGGR